MSKTTDNLFGLEQIMRVRLFACCVLLWGFTLLAVPFSSQAEETHAPLLYPLTNSKPIAVPTVVLDLSAVPEASVWAKEAVTLIKDWFPLIWMFLATDSATPPKTIRLIFTRKLDAAGIASGNDLTINANVVLSNPNDFGLIIHELTHIIQAYPDAPDKPDWLGEGIADYIRYWRYEPERPHPRIDPQKASYRDGYGTTGAFLAWLLWKYDRRIVRDLDGALRTGKYNADLFAKRTLKPLDTLWTEFLADQKQP